MKTNTLRSLSEQNLIDCSKNFGNNGCNGGLMDNAFRYIEKRGIDTENGYPFEGRDSGRCRFSTYTEINAKLSHYVDLPSGDEEALAEAVARYGPISIAIDASHRSLQLYTHGIYSEPKCGNTTATLDHAVLVVGYGTDEITGMDYWIIKNSWSATWGEAGYFRMARNKGMCGVALMASYPEIAVHSHSEF